MTDQSDGMDTAGLLPVLEQEVLGITRAWKTFLELYGESEERIELLNSVGQDFFETIWYALRDATIMGLARLTDGKGRGDRKNASFQRLVEGLDDNVDIRVVEKAQDLLGKIEDLSSSINDVRNKRIGHNDIDTLRGSYEVSPLFVNDVEQCIELMQYLLNVVSAATLSSTTAYETPQPGSAEVVLDYLKRGLEAQ